VLFYYRIDNQIAVGPPWWRSLISKAPAGILLQTRSTFPPNHPTTKICLRLLLHDLKGRRCRSLLDVGCGSGILALAGLKLGVERAVALDISMKALLATRANAELNRLEKRLFLVKGSTEAVAGWFDLVLANLPMPLLVEKLSDLIRLAEPGASLVLSGFQDLDKPWLREEISGHGFVAEHWLSEDLSFPAIPPSGSYTWMAVLAHRKNSRK
jgi:ribosomal protein L11 methyltransferase